MASASVLVQTFIVHFFLLCCFTVAPNTIFLLCCFTVAPRTVMTDLTEILLHNIIFIFIDSRGIEREADPVSVPQRQTQATLIP